MPQKCGLKQPGHRMEQPWAHMAKRTPGPSAAVREVTDPILRMCEVGASVVKGPDAKGEAVGGGNGAVLDALLALLEGHLVPELLELVGLQSDGNN